MKRLPCTLAVAAAVLGMSGCAAAGPTTLPDGLTVTAFQNRFDYGARVLELKVANGSGAPLTITRATFESTRFAEPVSWDRETDIPVGAARDLRVHLPDAVCDGGAEPSASVTLEFELAGGMTGSARVTPDDPMGQLDVIAAADCLVVAVDRHATITAADTLDWTPGERSPAVLDIVIDPTGADGTLEITSARDTILFALVAADGSPSSAEPLGIVIGPDSEETVVHLELVPNRCDPHAVAEDKRGTFFPLEVSASEGRTGTMWIPVSAGVKSELYAFVASWCGAG
jgi:hypothetical protein